MPTSWDSLFKKIFLRLFLQLALVVKTQQEVSHQALMIDAVVICQSEADVRKLQKTAFYFFQEHNLLEFKSSEDRLTIPGYHRIQSRARLYLSETEKLTIDRMSLCIISSADPRNVRDNIPRISFTRVEQGYYLATGEPIETHLYVISHLPIEPKYYPMLLFSKGKKRKQFLKVLAEKNELEYLHLAMLLYPEEVKEVYQMSGKDYPTLEENIRFIISDVGAQTVLREMTAGELEESLHQIVGKINQKALLKALVEQAGRENMQQLLQKVFSEDDAQ